MTTIENFDKKTCALVRDELQAELEKIADRLGLTVTIGGGKYDPTHGTFTPKVEFAVAAKKNESVRRDLGYLHIDAEYGTEFVSNGKCFVIEGVNFKAPKYPVNTRCVEDGRTYKHTEAQVRKCLGQPEPFGTLTRS